MLRKEHNTKRRQLIKKQKCDMSPEALKQSLQIDSERKRRARNNPDKQDGLKQSLLIDSERKRRAREEDGDRLRMIEAKSKKKARNNPDKKESLKEIDKDSKRRARNDPIRNEILKRNDKKKHEKAKKDPARNERLKKKNKEGKQRSRLKIGKTEDDRYKLFNDLIKKGAIYECCSCERLLYKNAVSALTNELRKNIDEKDPSLLERSIGELTENANLCNRCQRYFRRKKKPPQSHKNKLESFKVTNDTKALRVTDLENVLIAKRLLFIKIVRLPKSRVSAIKGKVVNVPVLPSDVVKTIRSFPRK